MDELVVLYYDWFKSRVQTKQRDGNDIIWSQEQLRPGFVKPSLRSGEQQTQQLLLNLVQTLRFNVDLHGENGLL